MLLRAAAEVAVARAGGLRAVLAAAGVTLDHLEVKEPLELPGHSAAAAAGQYQQQQLQCGDGAAGDAASDAQQCTHGHTIGLAAAAKVSTPSAAGAPAATEPGLAVAPDFSWSADDSLLLRLVDYELVVVLLNSAKPPLLGKGGAIPQNTLEAFR